MILKSLILKRILRSGNECTVKPKYARPLCYYMHIFLMALPDAFWAV